MNDDLDKKQFHKKGGKTAKEIAFGAVFVALAIGAQVALSAVPGVELVSLLFVAYAFVFGARRGMLAATAFSLLRQFVFGVFPNVLILYLIYYNLLALCLGLMGKNACLEKRIWCVTAVACVCTVGFHLLDFFLTAIIGGYSQKAQEIYFTATIPVMLAQVACVAVTVGGLFIPLGKIFQSAKKKMK